jgi:hypothetical protein
MSDPNATPPEETTPGDVEIVSNPDQPEAQATDILDAENKGLNDPEDATEDHGDEDPDEDDEEEDDDAEFESDGYEGDEA